MEVTVGFGYVLEECVLTAIVWHLVVQDYAICPTVLDTSQSNHSLKVGAKLFKPNSLLAAAAMAETTVTTAALAGIDTAPTKLGCYAGLETMR